MVVVVVKRIQNIFDLLPIKRVGGGVPPTRVYVVAHNDRYDNLFLYLWSVAVVVVDVPDVVSAVVVCFCCCDIHFLGT